MTKTIVIVKKILFNFITQEIYIFYTTSTIHILVNNHYKHVLNKKKSKQSNKI